MLIAQISDLHMAPEGVRTLGHVETAAALARVVAHVNATTPRPDFAVITGDLTNDGTLAEAHHARALLDGLACPWMALPGNHDRRATLAPALGPHLGRGPGPFACFVRDLDGLRLIGLDTLDEGAPGGLLCADRLEWLAGRLAEGGDRPVALFLHHPPRPLGVPETDEDGFRGAGELARLVAGAPQLRLVAAGHIHLPTASLWQGRPLVTAPSIAMQLTRDFSAAPPPSRFTRSAPAYALHKLLGDGAFVSHTVTIGDDERPWPFAPLTPTQAPAP